MHDRNGKPLAEGDKVVIEGTITKCYEGADPAYCNVQVTTDVPMAGNPYNVSLSAGQTTKVETE